MLRCPRDITPNLDSLEKEFEIGISFAFNFRFSFDICKLLVYLEILRSEDGGEDEIFDIVGDGMADYPMESLGGKTPLMVARTPFMDWMVKHGEIGLVKTVPDGFIPGSEIANLSILGYDPHLYYRGRGPLEAASLGIRLQPDDIAFRCNLVTLKQEGNRTFMEDFCCGPYQR